MSTETVLSPADAPRGAGGAPMANPCPEPGAELSVPVPCATDAPQVRPERMVQKDLRPVAERAPSVR